LRNCLPRKLASRQRAADTAFLSQGITCTVRGQSEGIENIFPYDLVPRIITAAEWRKLEAGLEQRIVALNLFLKDLYTDANVLRYGIVSKELNLSYMHYRRKTRVL
jgi:uncharacterized circularly permuted ATP-grasp superfamily protein